MADNSIQQKPQQKTEIDGDVVVTHRGNLFTYADACSLAEKVLGGEGQAGAVFLDLGTPIRTTTAALAKLILLRLRLLKNGRELYLLGLRGQVKSLYEISRMTRLLPRRGSSTKASRPSEQEKPTASRPGDSTLEAPLSGYQAVLPHKELHPCP